MKKIVAVLGDSKIDKNSDKYNVAFNLGKALVDAGYRVQSGGLNGVMQAVFEGAKSSDKYQDGDTIALIPSFDRTKVNAYADIVIPTGIDVMRNAMVASADAVVAIGGGAGTLSEMAMAWSLFRLIIAYDNVDGWSQKLAGQKIDDKKRYDFDDDQVFATKTHEQTINILNEKIDKYTKFHQGIVYRQ